MTQTPPLDPEAAAQHPMRLQFYAAREEEAQLRVRAAVDLAQDAIKALLLINGGAIVALFTLIGQGAESTFVQRVNMDLIWIGFAAYAVGIVTGDPGPNLRFRQSESAGLSRPVVRRHSFPQRAGPATGGLKASWTIWANRLINIGTVLAAVSVIAFASGSGIALKAAQGASRPPAKPAAAAQVVAKAAPTAVTPLTTLKSTKPSLIAR